MTTKHKYKGQNKKLAVGVCFIIFMVVAIFFIVVSDSFNADNLNLNKSNDDNAKDAKDKNVSTDEANSKINKTIKLRGENIAIVHYSNLTYIANKPNVDSKADLEAYKQRAENRLKEFAETNPNENVFATITYKKPLSEQKLNEILDNNSIHAYLARYVSYPEGGGIHPLPISKEERNELKNMEKNLKNDFMTLYNDQKNLKLNENKNAFDWSNFKLIDGYVATKVHAESENLLELQKHQDVLLVDIGPIEIGKNYSNSEVRSTDDIYDEYNKYR